LDKSESRIFKLALKEGPYIQYTFVCTRSLVYQSGSGDLFIFCHGVCVSAGVKAAKQNIYNATERDKAGRNRTDGAAELWMQR